MSKETKQPKDESIKDFFAFRRSLGLNQTQFWKPLGVTQSGGSRYESGRAVPKPVQKLAILVYKRGIEAPAV